MKSLITVSEGSRTSGGKSREEDAKLGKVKDSSRWSRPICSKGDTEIILFHYEKLRVYLSGIREKLGMSLSGLFRAYSFCY